MIATIIAPSAVIAQETLYIGGSGGSKQVTLEEQLVPAFESRTGANVVYVPASSSDTLAKVIAQKGNQDLSLLWIDSSVMLQAIDLDLCAPLPQDPVINDIYPPARMDGGTAIGTGFYATGLAYNTEVFAKNGWDAPTSWNDLGDSKYKGKVTIGPFAGFGVEALVMVAKANGGSEANIEPGFKAFSEKIASNVFAWEGNNSNVSQMLQTGEAALAVWSDTRTMYLADQGAPVKFAVLKEGAEQAMTAACVVKGAPQQELAERFLIESLLSPEGQVAMAESAGYGPTNSKVKLEPELAAKVIYGLDQVKKLVPTDWLAVNKQREDWTKRWNREVER
ncbi:MAG: ABC transporter substrate-binding protein [Mesorhizobium sp.]|nr:ABC transporter substrate-binding protein [Mesorhizobium sp. M5C.F.Ca.IN.020.14.1.1]RWG50781.1 MAG: ABC transporter substrate-binding protein [Mesorhizobium sp.]RWH55768.1 MAG: ABC transporter substrate-binding protein [Mesorhizobium sp.]RWI67886.1 MAG: ABC transporter substrate-binding protein [Mesorhizobium sp.]RWI77875.1 MAG: ABC transporter substrate-binding protein [Mesorhizobium sp.]